MNATAAKTEPHEELIDTVGLFPPGDGVVALNLPKDGKLTFKAFGAERVDGIDYDVFKILAVWVGQKIQWNGTTFGEHWPAADLLKKWDGPMDTAQSGQMISIQLRNESDRPRRFAVKLVGKRLV